MEPDNVRARAALLSQIGAQRARLLRELRAAVALSASHGIDIRVRVRQFLRSVAPELVPAGPGGAAEPAAYSARPDDAEAVVGLYSELGDLAASGDQPAYGRTLRRLRQLQLRHAEHADDVLRAHLSAAAGEAPQSSGRTPARARRPPATRQAVPAPTDPAASGARRGRRVMSP